MALGQSERNINRVHQTHVRWIQEKRWEDGDTDEKQEINAGFINDKEQREAKIKQTTTTIITKPVGKVHFSK